MIGWRGGGEECKAYTKPGYMPEMASGFAGGSKVAAVGERESGGTTSQVGRPYATDNIKMRNCRGLRLTHRDDRQGVKAGKLVAQVALSKNLITIVL